MATDLHLPTDPTELEQQQAAGTFYLLRIAWQNKWLVGLGMLAGLLVGALFYAQQKPRYEASGQILVVKKQPDVLPIQGIEAKVTSSEDYLATQAALMKSPVIAGRAARKRDLGGLRSFAGGADPAAEIISALTVTNEGRSGILKLAFTGPDADDCRVVLEAVIGGYKDFLDENYKDTSVDTVRLITDARDTLQKDLGEKERKYREFRAKAPLLWKGKDGSNPHSDRMTNIETKRSDLVIRRAEMEGRLRALEDGLREGRSPAELVAIARQAPPAGQRPEPAGASALDDQMAQLEFREETLLADYGPDHPKVQAVRREIRQARRLLERRAARTLEEARLKDRGDDPAEAQRLKEEVRQYVVALRRDLRDLEVAERALAALADKEKAEAKALAQFEVDDDIQRGEIAHSRQLYAGIIRRLEEVQVVKPYGGYNVQVISPPGQGTKVAPKPVPIFAASLVLGLLAGLGLAYLADRTDHTFRNPEEIRRRLNLPVVGHVPLMATSREGSAAGRNGGGTLDPVLCTYHRPRSRDAEAYRGVRTALYFSVGGEGHKVIQVTSPMMADGKTTLAANLAVSIAQSGKTVALVEADFRRPRVHKMFAVPNDAGLATVIAGESRLDEVIRPTSIPGLSVVGCGPRPENPAELLTSPLLETALAALRERFDFILVDTPPLLAVTDPCVVCPRVDGVLLVIRASKNGRPTAERARDILATLGATVLGVVVNGVTSPRGGRGYQYGYYNYGYKQGYSYSSSYGYGEDGNGDYVEEDVTAVAGPSAEVGEGEPAAARGNGRSGFWGRWWPGASR